MDETRKSGQGLRHACESRRAELKQVLDFLGKDDASATRKDVEAALAALSALLTGDLDHIDSMTGEQLNRWLHGSRHLGLKEQRAIAARLGTPRAV